MKRLRFYLSLFLAVVLVFGLASPAFASNVDTYVEEDYAQHTELSNYDEDVAPPPMMV